MFNFGPSQALCALSEIHKVTLGVHRYEKCDLIGDDMGDEYLIVGQLVRSNTYRL